ncbi:MAG TPA: hypothetical protein VHN98_02670, partial [Acidimicrobiales bacterium]|nr:hypothetical protein [Acidimicrobiales bacterium]
MITVEYQCADGTPFPVRFASADDAAAMWRTDREHARDPRTPLGEALERLGVPGSERAYAEAGMPMPPTWRPGPDANGFAYYSPAPMPAEDREQMARATRALIEEHGSSEAIWRRFCLPRVVDAVDRLNRAGDGEPFAALAEAQAYGQQMTMIAAIANSNDLDLLDGACREVCGDDARMVAYELAQGHPNSTLRADEELWRLGRRLRSSPELVAALAAGDPAREMDRLRGEGHAGDFFAALDAFLGEFGQRAEVWDIGAPTWNDRRAGFWHQLRAVSADGVASPEEARAAAAQRRDVLAADVASRFTDPEARARFDRRRARIATYVDVREDRAHWQLVLVGSLRDAVLRRGARLVGRRLLADREDVLFVTPEEIAAGGPLRALVAERRAAHAGWMRRVPPLTIG